MSTRATYSFHDNEHDTLTTLYIHHDGYEEGAAWYAYQVAKANGEQSKGGTAEMWLRALPTYAELTRSHEAHGDTEYQYHFTANGSQVAVKAVNTSRGWTTIYKGDTAAWINSKCDEAQEAPPEAKAIHFHGCLRRVVNVWEIVTETCAKVLDMLRKGQIGNASGTLTTLDGVPVAVLSPTVADFLAKTRKAVDKAWEAHRAGLPAPSIEWAKPADVAGKDVAGTAAVVHAVSLDGGPDLVEPTATPAPVVESQTPPQTPQLAPGMAVVWTKGKRQGQTGTVRTVRADGRLVIDSGDKIHGEQHGITADNVKAV